MIRANVQHHVNEGKRECFKGLTADRLEQSVQEILSDSMIAQQIKLRLGVAVKGVDLSNAGKGDPRGDVISSINYRHHTGNRQSDKDTAETHQSVPTLVRDARELSKPPTVSELGFALRHQPTGMSQEDFYNESKITKTYYKLCEEVVKQETGAAAVKCFHHAGACSSTLPPVLTDSQPSALVAKIALPPVLTDASRVCTFTDYALSSIHHRLFFGAGCLVDFVRDLDSAWQGTEAFRRNSSQRLFRQNGLRVGH